MFSRSIGIGLLAAGCLTAGAGGAYLATRDSAPLSPAASAPQPAAAAQPAQAAQPVSETEAVVRPEEKPSVAAEPAPVEAPAPRVARPEPAAAPTPARRTVAPPVTSRVPVTSKANVERAQVEKRDPEVRAADPAAPVETAKTAPTPVPSSEASARTVEPSPAPAAPAEPRFEEIILPSSTVIGLEVETPVSSERAQVEDRVDARVTRDVYVDGRLVIPSRSRMIGAVTLVERGGKVKERARLGVRFHTLVLDGGRQVAVRTETIMREGEPPAAESSKKIGGAAIGGAVLGAIIGGGKGAVLGGAAGAAGGTAAVMAGGRNPATLAGGTIVTARLAGPVAIDVEKR
jgi:type IV secretory pathway VirB10-like protein